MDPKTAILDLLAERAPGATICPSEAARRLDEEGWRDRMGDVRAAGTALAAERQIVVLQKGERVDSRSATGPIRYGKAEW